MRYKILKLLAGDYAEGEINELASRGWTILSATFVTEPRQIGSKGSPGGWSEPIYGGVNTYLVAVMQNQEQDL